MKSLWYSICPEFSKKNRDHLVQQCLFFLVYILFETLTHSGGVSLHWAMDCALKIPEFAGCGAHCLSTFSVAMRVEYWGGPGCARLTTFALRTWPCQGCYCGVHPSQKVPPVLALLSAVGSHPQWSARAFCDGDPAFCVWTVLSLTLIKSCSQTRRDPGSLTNTQSIPVSWVQGWFSWSLDSWNVGSFHSCAIRLSLFEAGRGRASHQLGSSFPSAPSLSPPLPPSSLGGSFLRWAVGQGQAVGLCPLLLGTIPVLWCGCQGGYPGQSHLISKC